MPLNRLALIRYKTIDDCLSNRARKWTLDKLMEACSDALYEYEGIKQGVSRRTVQLDLQLMRSDKLGYNAPIIVVDKKYYTYEDPKYSIRSIPLTKQDLSILTEVKDILKQFKGFSHFQEVGDMINRLEDKIYTSSSAKPSIIEFETNERLRGLEFLGEIHKAIVNKKVLKFTYQSFTARQPKIILFHAYLLKEFRNRWFVLGKSGASQPTLTLALDRIRALSVEDNITYMENIFFNAQTYYKDIIGVTKTEKALPNEVILKINARNAPYIVTKPIHNSQEVLEQHDDGSVTIKIVVQLNLELEREILGFGDDAQVIAPLRLKDRIQYRLQKALDIYQEKNGY